jgi:hypothetical protein
VSHTQEYFGLCGSARLVDDGGRAQTNAPQDGVAPTETEDAVTTPKVIAESFAGDFFGGLDGTYLRICGEGSG